MKSNGPTRHDKFAWAWAKLKDITKKREGELGKGGRGVEGGGKWRKVPMVGVHDSLLKCPSH